jgi:FkbM family methyltransferase
VEREQLKLALDYLAQNSDSLLFLGKQLSAIPSRQLSISEQGIILRLNHEQLQFYWNPEDPRTAIASLVVQGEYEPIVSALFDFLTPRLESVLDIGANVGYYSVRFGKGGRDDLQVHAFEPLPKSCRTLAANLALNGLSQRIKIHQFALGNKDDSARLFVPHTSGTSAASLADLHPDESSDVVDVITRRLDSVFPEMGLSGVDLMKMDVEGAEAYVIDGGWQTISRFRPMIFAELLRKWSSKFGYHPNEVLSRLRGLGYSCFAVGQSLRLIENINEETVETNFFFLCDSDSHNVVRKSLETVGFIR